MTQHALPGLQPPPTLTARQSLALAILRDHAPVNARELGRLLREARGIGTARYDTENGLSVLKELRAKGLAKLRVKKPSGWVPAEWRLPVEGYDPASADWPVGF